ncbi:hypothetical protein KS4_34270 [Poriferisphaera corsica]|uniref:Uncharacterized protein n=2 Tax=Poriferisphaera corsica TaxID=2528020 RepID=A0A517YYR5_9BACT|nr:hypothetical protein KS4_34270 [Poriferisphaera corsica]
MLEIKGRGKGKEGKMIRRFILLIAMIGACSSSIHAAVVTHSFFGTVTAVDTTANTSAFTNAKIGDAISFHYSYDQSHLYSSNTHTATFDKPFDFWSVSIGSQTVSRYGSFLHQYDFAAVTNDDGQPQPADSLLYNLYGNSLASWAILLVLDDFDGLALSRADLSDTIDFNEFDITFGNIVVYAEGDQPANSPGSGSAPTVAIDFSLDRFEAYQPYSSPTPSALAAAILLLPLTLRRARAHSSI